MSDVTSTAPISFSGIESGLDTQAIISAEIAADSVPLNDFKSEESADNAQISDYQSIQSQLQTLQSAADQLTSPDAFASAVSASSSDAAVATATTGAGATTGSMTFSVDQLATADTMVSAGTVASTNDVVASGDLLVSSGGSGLGIGSISGSGLTTGSHSVAVTQASSGATIVGFTPLSASTQITGSNDQLTVAIDGASSTFTIPDGTYTPQQLATAVSTSSGGLLSAELAPGGQLILATTEQGSQATLQVDGGSAMGALGVSAGSAVSGTDGIITVDGQANTISDISATGSTVTLSSGGGGTVTADLSSGGLSVGTMSAQNVSVGDGSLSSVVSAINSANVGITAETLEVGTDQFALLVTSNSTGAANNVSISPSAFSSSSLGSLETTTAGQDAVVTLGGPGGDQVSSASNTISGLMPGVSVSVTGISSSPVTISVNPDGTSAASTVQSFVTAANAVLASISTDTAYDQAAATAGPLNGDYELSALGQSIVGVVSQALGSSSAIDLSTTGSAAGLSFDASTDQINFDATTFASDFDNDPGAVSKMFTQGGSFVPTGGSPATPSDITLAYAADTTEAGTYDVDITQSATQAIDTGTSTFASGSSTVGSAETYTVTSGGSTANYVISAGETLDQIASGLDGAFAQGGLDLSAQVVNNGSQSSLQITSASYGSQASFSVSSSGSDQLGVVGSSFAGTDVAGTINGVAGNGDGQILAAPTSDPTLAGLSLLVTTPGITSSTDLGSYTYDPGLAGGIAHLSALAVSSSGELPTKITSLQNTVTNLGDQVTIQQQLVSEEQDQLDAEFDSLESTLSTLNSEQAYLTSTFGSSANTLGSLDGDAGASSSSGSTNNSTGA